MADQKEIKRRIKSVKNIGQITKALQLVSAVKMKQSQEALHNARIYFGLLEDNFLAITRDMDQDTLESLLRGEEMKKKDAITKTALIVISPSKGFAGPLISNLTKKTVEFLENREQNTDYIYDEFIVYTETEEGRDALSKATDTENQKVDIKLITVDKKSKDMAIRLHKEVIADFPTIHVPPTFGDVTPMISIMLDAYKAGTIDEVYLVYTHFINTFQQNAVLKKLLPLSKKKKYIAKKTEKDEEAWYSYSSTKQELFTSMYPAYLESELFHAALDAVAAEHSARMLAMQKATDNAKDIRRELTLEYNQKRPFIEV